MTFIVLLSPTLVGMVDLLMPLFLGDWFFGVGSCAVPDDFFSLHVGLRSSSSMNMIYTYLNLHIATCGGRQVI